MLNFVLDSIMIVIAFILVVSILQSVRRRSITLDRFFSDLESAWREAKRNFSKTWNLARAKTHGDRVRPHEEEPLKKEPPKSEEDDYLTPEDIKELEEILGVKNPDPETESILTFEGFREDVEEIFVSPSVRPGFSMLKDANITQSLKFGNAGNDHLFNLNGHTFTVNVPSGTVYFNSDFSYADNPGTMVLKGAGWGVSIFDDATIWATTVTFRVSTRVNLSKNVQFHMLDYIAEHTGNMLLAKEGSQLYVYGTFKPNTANSYFVGPQMQDNAAVDLSEMTGPWSVKSGGSNLTTCKYVTFADGARVNVNLGGRKVPGNEAIMTWDAESKPANLATLTFKGVFNDRIVTLSKREDGLYMPRGLVIIVK